MKKIKKYLFLIVLLLCIACPIFSGCTFSCINETDERELTIFPSSKVLSWKPVTKATEYEIYCDGTLIDTLSSEECLYQFGGLLDEVRDYEFSVKAKMSNYNIYSPVVQTATYSNTTERVSFAKSSTSLEYDNLIDLELSDLALVFEKLDDITDYRLAIYSNDLGYREYDIDPRYNASNNKYTLQLNPQEYSLRGNISAIRLRAIIDDVDYIVSDIEFYNPDNFKGYTDNIYIFDGKIYDHYINTLDELQNIIYYSFISRTEDFNIKLSEELYNMAKVMGEDNFEECLDMLIYQYGFGSFSETMAYMAGNVVGSDRYFSTAISAKNRTYNIKVTYLGVRECDLRNTSKTMTQEMSTPYYETTGYVSLYEKYGDSYTFASDNKFLECSVETSEELYWAVENGVKPVFVSETCRGYQVYDRAKSTLREIISEEMSDYEKVLSIFDWICVNTVYDYGAYSSNDNLPTKYPCYYLEGVFLTGTAVCDGFSKAFSLMCNMLDIEAIRIVGTATTGGSEGGHAWNKVLLDKDPDDTLPAQYYIVDITWTEIFSASTNEILSHKYFLVNDAMIEDTHKNFPRREKFSGMPAPAMYEYYNSMTFDVDDVSYDYAIDCDEDVSALFEYMLGNSVTNIELVFDIDYLTIKYEEITGNRYNIQTDFRVTLDGIVYYTNLKNTFMSYLKECKFAEQYIFLASALGAIVYNNSGDLGIVYSLNQRFLVNEDGEVEHLVAGLDEFGTCGTFYLYVDNEMFNGISTNNYLEKVRKLFADALESSNIEITFEFVEANVLYDETEGRRAAVYLISVTEKTL